MGKLDTPNSKDINVTRQILRNAQIPDFIHVLGRQFPIYLTLDVPGLICFRRTQTVIQTGLNQSIGILRDIHDRVNDPATMGCIRKHGRKATGHDTTSHLHMKATVAEQMVFLTHAKNDVIPNTTDIQRWMLDFHDLDASGHHIAQNIIGTLTSTEEHTESTCQGNAAQNSILLMDVTGTLLIQKITKLPESGNDVTISLTASCLRIKSDSVSSKTLQSPDMIWCLHYLTGVNTRQS